VTGLNPHPRETETTAPAGRQAGGEKVEETKG
jgi:hypothetical protein